MRRQQGSKLSNYRHLFHKNKFIDTYFTVRYLNFFFKKSRSLLTVGNLDHVVCPDPDPIENISIRVPNLNDNKTGGSLFTLTPQEIAQWIDQRSRIAFPAAFLVFNCFYWLYVYFWIILQFSIKLFVKYFFIVYSVIYLFLYIENLVYKNMMGNNTLISICIFLHIFCLFVQKWIILFKVLFKKYKFILFFYILKKLLFYT